MGFDGWIFIVILAIGVGGYFGYRWGVTKGFSEGYEQGVKAGKTDGQKAGVKDGMRYDTMQFLLNTLDKIPYSGGEHEEMRKQVRQDLINAWSPPKKVEKKPEPENTSDETKQVLFLLFIIVFTVAFFIL